MRKILLVAALTAVASAASAADLPSRRIEPSFPVVQPAFSWTGAYVGGNAGYAFGAESAYTLGGFEVGNLGNIITGLRPANFTTRANGFTGGGQVGYNQQIGNVFGFAGFQNEALIAGVEADAAFTGLRANGTFVGIDPRRATTFQSRTDFVGTVRGRLGLAFDNLLVFGSVGFAYGSVQNGMNFYIGPRLDYAGTTRTLRAGYAYGGGIEYAFPTTSILNPLGAAAVTLKVEYLYYDLGTSKVAAPNLNGFADGYTARVRNDGNLVRAGLNYKIDFAASPAPVVARY